ncbi:MAG: hypothetical protein ACKODX_18020 [Gemmata sp.]
MFVNNSEAEGGVLLKAVTPDPVTRRVINSIGFTGAVGLAPPELTRFFVRDDLD